MKKENNPGTQKLTVKPSKHPQDWGLLVKFCCGIYLPALFSKYFSKETSAGFCWGTSAGFSWETSAGFSWETSADMSWGTSTGYSWETSTGFSWGTSAGFPWETSAWVVGSGIKPRGAASQLTWNATRSKTIAKVYIVLGISLICEK